MRRFFIAMIMGFVLFSAGYASGDSKIVYDAGSIKPFADFSRWATEFTEAAKMPETVQIPQDSTIFKVVSVNNIQGNNPFFQLQPVMNFNGVAVATVEDLIRCVAGGVCQTQSASAGQTITCAPGTARSSVADLRDSVGVYVYGSACRVLSKASADVPNEIMYAIWNVPASGFAAATASTGTYTNSWDTPPSNTPAPGGGDAGWMVSNNNTYTGVVKHGGVKYRINFSLAEASGHDVRVTVNSLQIVP